MANKQYCDELASLCSTLGAMSCGRFLAKVEYDEGPGCPFDRDCKDITGSDWYNFFKENPEDEDNG